LRGAGSDDEGQSAAESEWGPRILRVDCASPVPLPARGERERTSVFSYFFVCSSRWTIWLNAVLVAVALHSAT
jgi:hypothetical protein